jgi:hypothetical protein
MKRLILWLTAALLVTVTALPCWASSVYLVYDQWGGSWQDANKTVANTEDDLMCWAAAASNVLAWGHWGTPTYNTADQIFIHFQDHWTDDGGYPSWAYKWWMNGAWPPYSVASVPDVPGGGNFYPLLNFDGYYVYGSGGNLLMSGIDGLMHQGYGVALNITNGGSMLHSITAWGFEYDNSGGSVVYQGIFVTDSDDAQTALVEYPLIWQNDQWYLGGGYAGWQLSSFMALQPFQTPLTPSWVLLGTGLAALLGRRLRRGRQGR